MYKRQPQGRGGGDSRGYDPKSENLVRTFNRQASISRSDGVRKDGIKSSAGPDPAGTSKIGLAAGRPDPGEAPKA